jgi:hypothetical protein
LINHWPKERVLRELTGPEHQEMCWDSTNVNVFADEFRMRRDEVLVAELVRRGVNGKRRWLIIALVAIVLFLSFMFYEAKNRPGEPTPKSVPLQPPK